MNYQIIQIDQIIYAIIVRANEVNPGLNFYTKDSDFLQVATWSYDSGKILKAHAHKLHEKESNLTQEFIFIKKGALRVDLYDRDDKKFVSEKLLQGDFAALLQGGHGYEILENGTEVVEVKNGPFLGLDIDKRLI